MPGRARHLPAALERSLALAVVALLVVTDWSLVKHAATGPIAITVPIARTLMLLVRVPLLVGVLAAIAVGIRW
jgi:hypothetical protein